MVLGCFKPAQALLRHEVTLRSLLVRQLPRLLAQAFLRTVPFRDIRIARTSAPYHGTHSLFLRINRSQRDPGSPETTLFRLGEQPVPGRHQTNKL